MKRLYSQLHFLSTLPAAAVVKCFAQALDIPRAVIQKENAVENCLLYLLENCLKVQADERKVWAAVALLTERLNAKMDYICDHLAGKPTLLHRALQCNVNEAIFTIMLSNSNNHHLHSIVDEDGNTILHLAVKMRKNELVPHILCRAASGNDHKRSKSAKFNYLKSLLLAQNKQGRTALHLAAADLNKQLVQTLLLAKKKATTDLVTVKDNHGMTAFMASIEGATSKTREEAEQFTQAWFDLALVHPSNVAFATDNNKQTALHRAALIENTSVLEILFSVVGQESIEKLMVEKDSNGRTPYHVAAEKGNTTAIQFFLTKLANNPLLMEKLFSCTEPATKSGDVQAQAQSSPPPAPRRKMSAGKLVEFFFPAAAANGNNNASNVSEAYPSSASSGSPSLQLSTLFPSQRKASISSSGSASSSYSSSGSISSCSSTNSPTSSTGSPASGAPSPNIFGYRNVAIDTRSRPDFSVSVLHTIIKRDSATLSGMTPSTPLNNSSKLPLNPLQPLTQQQLIEPITEWPADYPAELKEFVQTEKNLLRTVRNIEKSFMKPMSILSTCESKSRVMSLKKFYALFGQVGIIRSVCEMVLEDLHETLFSEASSGNNTSRLIPICEIINRNTWLFQIYAKYIINYRQTEPCLTRLARYNATFAAIKDIASESLSQVPNKRQSGGAMQLMFSIGNVFAASTSTQPVPSKQEYSSASEEEDHQFSKASNNNNNYSYYSSSSSSGNSMRELPSLLYAPVQRLTSVLLLLKNLYCSIAANEENIEVMARACSDINTAVDKTKLIIDKIQAQAF